jgi:hypothetical protein
LYPGPMCRLGPDGIMLSMNPSSAAVSKVMLVADRSAPSHRAGAMPIRRFRIARLRLDGRLAQPESRFEHLKRVFD